MLQGPLGECVLSHAGLKTTHPTPQVGLLPLANNVKHSPSTIIRVCVHVCTHRGVVTNTCIHMIHVMLTGSDVVVVLSLQCH